MQGGGDGRAAAAERVHDDVARVGGGLDDALEQGEGFLGGVAEAFSGLGTFEVILCRNVLIYFDDARRRMICDQFFAMLTDGGWLLLGSAENLYGISDRFVSVRFGDTLVYRKPPLSRSPSP